jgi:hypothetical protein
MTVTVALGLTQSASLAKVQQALKGFLFEVNVSA